MSLRPQQPLPLVPDDTARIARAAFRRGKPYVLLRDRLGAVFADGDFADLYPALGQPAYAPWRLALVTLMQCRPRPPRAGPPPGPAAAGRRAGRGAPTTRVDFRPDYVEPVAPC